MAGHPLPDGYLHTLGSSIVDANNNPVQLAGVNWYGFDCTSMVAGGLDHQPMDAICQTIADLGFNTIRLPFCVQVVQENPTITQYLDANPDLRNKTALEIMDALIASAGDHGLKVILDSHRSEAGWSTQTNGLWYTQAYPAAVWKETWATLVRRYTDVPSADNPTVIGCDLRNELGDPPPDRNAWPAVGGALWGIADADPNLPRNWVPAAEDAANNYILAINPRLLIFVEGVRGDPAGPALNNNIYWFGGNLMGVGNSPPVPGRPDPVPITLSVPNQLVYSVHDYGPDAVGWPRNSLPWVTLKSKQDDCNRVWDQTWGYIVKSAMAPIWVGEVGTVNGSKPGEEALPLTDYTEPNQDTPQGAWFSYLVSYIADLQANSRGGNWCYWSINGSQSPPRDPTLSDYYGILTPDWSEVASVALMDKLATIL